MTRRRPHPPPVPDRRQRGRRLAAPHGLRSARLRSAATRAGSARLLAAANGLTYRVQRLLDRRCAGAGVRRDRDPSGTAPERVRRPGQPRVSRAEGERLRRLPPPRHRRGPAAADDVACRAARHAGALADHPPRLRRGLELHRPLDGRAARLPARPGRRPAARRASSVFHCYDSFGGGLSVAIPYYESCDLADARHPQTILAYGLNGAALPVRNGAPIRVRIERQLGYKMAKYIHIDRACRQPRRLRPRPRRLSGRIRPDMTGTQASEMRESRKDAPQFDLVTDWAFEAPPERVWAILRAVEDWPSWWPSVRKVEPVAAGDGDGVGAIHRLTWQTALPYTLRSRHRGHGHRPDATDRGPRAGRRGRDGHLDTAPGGRHDLRSLRLARGRYAGLDAGRSAAAAAGLRVEPRQGHGSGASRASAAPRGGAAWLSGWRCSCCFSFSWSQARWRPDRRSPLRFPRAEGRGIAACRGRRGLWGRAAPAP